MANACVHVAHFPSFILVRTCSAMVNRSSHARKVTGSNVEKKKFSAVQQRVQQRVPQRVHERVPLTCTFT